MVKNPPANAGDGTKETWVLSLSLGRSPRGGQCSCWTVPWTEEPGGPQSIGSQRVGPRWKQLSTRVHMHTRVMVKIRDVKARLPVFKREPRVHP